MTDKGLALGRLGRTQEAITYFDKVPALDPNDVPALDDKGIALADLKKYDEALSTLRI
jgi:Flp pilus assembly protein TadD